MFTGSHCGTIGTTRMVITSAGYIGFGTNAPNQSFTVATGRANFDEQNNYYGVWIDGDTSAESFIGIGGWYNIGGRISDEGGNHLSIRTHNTSHKLCLQCTGGETVIGGAVTLSDDLVVQGDLTVQGTTTTLNTEVCTTSAMEITNAGTGPALVVNQTGSQPVIDFQDDGASTFYIEDGGNVGVGTTNPDRKLHVFISDTGVVPDANSNLVIEDNDSNNFINVLTNNTSQGGIFFGDSDDSNIAGMLYNHSRYITIQN